MSFAVLERTKTPMSCVVPIEDNYHDELRSTREDLEADELRGARMPMSCVV